MSLTDKSPKARASMRRPRGAVGRPKPDVARVAEALSYPGIDPRTWLSAGTVGNRDDDGEFTTTGFADSPGDGPQVPDSTYTDELGTVVDVRLEPAGDIITARWAGIGVGRFGRMLFPLRGGDEVIVLIPNGDRNSGAITVVAVLPNQTAQLPEDWNNDRVLFDLAVPFEIRAPTVKINGAAGLTLNGRPVVFSPESI